jgi:hypothetical protein
MSNFNASIEHRGGCRSLQLARAKSRGTPPFCSYKPVCVLCVNADEKRGGGCGQILFISNVLMYISAQPSPAQVHHPPGGQEVHAAGLPDGGGRR